jgi:hypothetical protein
MNSLINTIRNRNINEIRTNLKKVPLFTNLTKKIVSKIENKMSNSSITNPKCNF